MVGLVDERYRKVVMTISELFLDVEHTEAAFRQFARILRGSGYSLKELDEIYRDVAASLYINTYAPVGAWSGFDADWLMEKVESHRRRSHRGIFARLKSHLVTRSTLEEWQTLRALVATDVSTN
jgi:hypothetical protein